MEANLRPLGIRNFLIALSLASNPGLAAVAVGQGSSFAKLEFTGDTYIEVPRNWTYLNENIKNHLNTGGEAAARVAGMPLNPGENVILVAANAYTSFRTPSATLRLSVRQGDAPTQAQVREASKLAKAELAAALAPALEETRKAVIGIDGVRSSKTLRTTILNNKSLSCVFAEFETDTDDGVKLSQNYVCPLGTKLLKLSTSYRKSEAAMFRPVVQYVWQSLSASPGWKEYPITEDGFIVSLPSEPQRRLLPSKDGFLRLYESIEPIRGRSKFSIFVGQPERAGIYEPASMDAYLERYIKSLVQGAANAKLQFARRVTFRGQPASEYQFNHAVAGQPYVARGVAFMIDGGHMRVSMWHPANDPQANAGFDRFIRSFQLAPIAYRASDKQFSDPRGVTFSPPKGWLQEPTKNALQAARFRNLTRSLQLLVAGNPAYTCTMFQGELQASGRLKAASAVRLNEQTFSKLVTFEDVPKYGVRLTNVQYCINSRLGAVVLGGTEEESMFSRWAQVFEGTAASIRVR